MSPKAQSKKLQIQKLICFKTANFDLITATMTRLSLTLIDFRITHLVETNYKQHTLLIKNNTRKASQFVWFSFSWKFQFNLFTITIQS